MDTGELELIQRMLLGEATQQIDRPGLLGDGNVILAANRAACVLLGYSLPDLLACAPTDISLLCQDEFEEFLGLLSRHGRLTGTVWLRKRDGTDLAMEFSVWLVTVSAAPAWFAVYRQPAAGRSFAKPIELAEPLAV